MPFWRLLDDPFFVPAPTSGSGRPSTLFQPKFDVHETPESFVLEGELAGITDKNALDIHFSDQQTLVIHGRVERSRISGPNGDKPAEAHSAPNKPTVEDAPEEEESSKATDNNQVATTSDEKSVTKPSAPTHRIWVQERSVGEFQRSFNFPAAIDQDNVKAALKDGILTVTVPKMVQKGKKKINVE